MMTYLLTFLPLAVETPTPSLLQPNAGIFFWTLVVFLIVLGLLWKFAWGPITSALEKREETIDSSIRRAEEALAEAKAIQADNEKALRQAEQQAQQIMREARENADKLRQEEIDETRGQIQRMQEQARVEIEREKQGALNDLRSEVANLAILAAEKILGDGIDDERQRKLVDDFLDKLPQN